MGALLAGASAQNLVVNPTTTLASEAGNNTSTADTFTTSSNNNLGAANISKVSLRTLLYSGAFTGIYAHWMPWWGTTSHIDIGYDSSDPAEIKKQVDDMLSRGITGAIVDWYGPNNTHHNTATINLMNEANLRNGQFKFAVTEDGGALSNCAHSSTCNISSQMISDLTYAYNTFETSASYLTFNGRPVVFFFNSDRYGTLDWARIAAGVPGNPLFIFENSSGFTHAESDGAFSWVGTSSSPDNWGQSYLANFYQTGMSYPSLHTVGSTKKGFNDTMASWGSYRVMNQNCGQTWLSTFGEIRTLYSAGNQLESVQLVTWNDYEEGSEIESGIDNCVFLGASLNGSTLNWTLVGGSESTLDHYVVFISLDGQNLMPVTEPAVGTSALNLAGYGLAPGTYTLYVKAVGKPTLANKMSNPVTYVVGDQAPLTSVSVTPASGSAPLRVAASMAASDPDGVVTSTAIDFGDGTVVAGASATHTYTLPGQYRVVATAKDNSGASSASATLVTATNQSPVAALAVSPASGVAPVSVSASTAGSYDPDGSIASTSIDFGDGTVVNGASAAHTYILAGAYTVRATVKDNFGAFNRNSKSITVTGPSVSIGSPVSNATVNSPVHIVASATSGSAISSFTIYDNGQQVYSIAATRLDTQLKLMPDAQHTLTVRAIDAGGGAGESKVTVWVADQAPVAALSVTPSSGPAPLTVTASTAASTDPDNSIASSSIDFGDGSVASGQTASHTYRLSGTYTVKAIINDGLGGYASASQQVVVESPAIDQPPSAVLSVTPTSGTAPLSVTASTAGSRDPDGSISSSRIDFGDGTIASGSSATHTYSTPGLYTVTATVTDNGGLSATASVRVTAAGVRVQAPVSGSTVASPVHVLATAYSTHAFTAMKIYLDYVSVYSVASASIDTSIKMSAGAHHLTVQAWDSAGAIYKSSTNITVGAGLNAALSVTPTSGVAPLKVTASTSGSTDAIGTITSSIINFGDGTTLSGPSATHTYSAAGTYTVAATVSDSAGQSASATAAVTVTAPVYGVAVSSPTNGAAVSSPVHVVASATASHPIVTMKIYLDYVAVYAVSADKIDTNLGMSTGSHHLTVQAWDSTGAVYKSSLSITVK